MVLACPLPSAVQGPSLPLLTPLSVRAIASPVFARRPVWGCAALGRCPPTHSAAGSSRAELVRCAPAPQAVRAESAHGARSALADRSGPCVSSPAQRCGDEGVSPGAVFVSLFLVVTRQPNLLRSPHHTAICCLFSMKTSLQSFYLMNEHGPNLLELYKILTRLTR